MWLSTDELAARLKIPAKTLAVWASAGRGPRYARIGRQRRYRLSDLLAWEQDQFDKSRRPNTSEPTDRTRRSQRRLPTRKDRRRDH
ncbi:helix-turn-helix domain-containing protein [Nocardia australiensis]|uniref:helix-turn-helix domain-containing protein n=1 Tax=Nocardia australiensis TaxID=2887191 RepID=UPI001D134B80|nr:helix-turn-helix domain-containing protein [Nocardia australiensis]